MNESDFLEKLKDILDCEEDLTLDMELEGLDEWDSLGILGFLAEMAQYASGTLLAKDVKEAETVRDLYALIK